MGVGGIERIIQHFRKTEKDKQKQAITKSSLKLSIWFQFALVQQSSAKFVPYGESLAKVCLASQKNSIRFRKWNRTQVRKTNQI